MLAILIYLKKVALGVASLLLVGSMLANSASAFTNLTVNDSFFARDNGTKIALGTFIECNSTLQGHVTIDNGAGNGGTGVVTGGDLIDFDSCNLGSITGHYSKPWTLSFDGVGNASLFGVDITMEMGILGTCRYEGSLDLTYNEVTGEGVISGSLSRASGFCVSWGATESVTGTYLLSTTSGGSTWIEL